VAAIAPARTGDLLDLIQRSGLASKQALASLTLPAEPIPAATLLVQRGLLTPFQARMLLAGKTRGYRLGNYVIQDQVGVGGMGAVYLAVHAEIKRRVAIKVLNAAASVNQLALERFLREARTAAALDHPNIVKLFDVAREGDVRYLVMEFIEGRTLEQMLKDGPIPTARAVNIVSQVAAGLQHAYEKGIVHRDIKPANLIVGKDDIVRILDMGLARSTDGADHLTQHLDRGAVVGTADYVAPEQAVNDPNVDSRADIYSLGVTFFALVTGKPPFSGSTASKLLSHQLSSAPSVTSLDKTFPPGLAKIIEKMMQKRPSDRYATPLELIEALAPWMHEAPPTVAATAANSGRLTSPKLAAEKRGLPLWLWAAAIGVGLAAGVGAIVLAFLLKK